MNKFYSVAGPAKRGGQHSIGLFGVPGVQTARQPLPRVPKASRVKGALNSFDSDGLTPAHYAKPVAPKPPATATVATVMLDGEQYRELARIATQEKRSIRGLIRTATAEFVDRRRAERELAAMQAAARASDERERSRWADEDARVDFMHRMGVDADMDLQTWEVD